MSKIEWTQATWNPIAGCTIISPGCKSCYAMRMAKRLALMGQEKYVGTTNDHGRWTGLIKFDESALGKPLQRKTPTTYFVNSMSDLFHADIQFDWLDQIWKVMAETPQHTYQILTKRAGLLPDRVQSMVDAYGVLPNVWIGVSVENQHYADERIPYLLRTPAAIRFLSCEPLLGPLKMLEYLFHGYHKRFKPDIGWVIIGGESGPGSRPFDITWAYDIVNQCRTAGVAAFVKQLGADPKSLPAEISKLKDRKGGDWNEWPEALRVREMPEKVSA